MLVVGSGGVEVNGNQYDHSSNLDPAPDFQGVDPRRFNQLHTMANPSADWMNITFYSTEHGFAELGFYPTLDIARTPNTSTNTLPYSPEHGFTNQRADLNINQGAGYTTPETSILSVFIPIITPDRVLTALHGHRAPEASYSSPRLQQGGGSIQRPLRKLLPKPGQHPATPLRQSSSGYRFQCQICPKNYSRRGELNTLAREKHGAPKNKAGRPANRSRSVA
jgi:hypothetical protein